MHVRARGCTALAPVAAAFLVGVSCAPAPPADVLATWQGGEAKTADFEAFVQGLSEEQRRPAPDGSLEEWVREGLGQLAVRRIVAGEAAATSGEGDPRVTLRARYLASLQAGRRFVEQRCPEEPVAEEDLRRLYERQATRGSQEWILLRHIYKEVPAEAAAADRVRLRGETEGILEELRGGASFVEMARRHSDSETAEAGGLIGRISREAPMEAAFVEAAWNLADGERSEVLELANGFHIVLREDSGVDEPRPYEAAAPGIRRELLRARQEACGRRLLNEAASSMVVRFPEWGLPLRPRPDEPILWVGEEAFTTGQLDALVEDGGTLATSQNALQVLQQFAEALLLAASARRESPELDAWYRGTEETLERRLAWEQAWRRARRALIAARPEAELRRHFEENREQFRSEVQLDLGMILLRAADERPMQPTARLAATLAERVRRGESFEELARQASEHPSGREGGRLGPLPWTRASVLLGPDAVRAAAALAPGGVSGAVLIARRPIVAYAVLKLYSRQEAGEATFELARDRVIDSLMGRRVGELDDELRNQMLAQARFAINEAGLDAYLKGLGAATPS